MTGVVPAPAVRRLIAVCGADRSGRYDWLPTPRAGDLTVTLEGVAHADLADRRPLLFDELESWEQRSAAEYRIPELLSVVRSVPAVGAIGQAGYRLIDFAEFRLQTEIVQLLRGWNFARAAPGARELVCDPAAPPALLMGIRGGLGLDPAAVPYVIPPALPGSRLKRALARPVMHATAASSSPERVRIATVATGKLGLALDSLPDAALRELGIGTMPFPGLDYGNSALRALRRRLPMLATFGPARPGSGPAVSLPGHLDIAGEPGFDRALTLLVKRLLCSAAPELDGLVRAVRGFEQARSLRALVLPSAAYGASRFLIEWAHRRGVKVGAMQHGIYVFRQFHGEDHLADMVFCWGEHTTEQARDWPAPRPRFLPVGVPGTPRVAPRAPLDRVRRALIATSYAHETPVARVAFVESFVDALAPGLALLAEAGVELEFRTHPNEDPERYRHLFARRGLRIESAPGGPFAAAAVEADILIAAASSVAFEAAALGLPVLLWHSDAPRWVREAHLVTPWSESLPGMFSDAGEFSALVGALIDEPAEGLRVAGELARHLARYAQPFDSASFARALERLAA